MNYSEPLYRPPAEGQSLIFQVTLGCSWNQCAFCRMYATKQFRARDEETVLAEIREAAPYYQGIRKVFLADGNAMVLSTGRLLRILNTIKEVLPSVGRVSAYALPADILSKTPAELTELRAAGLQLIYVGIESGDDEVLRMIHKSENADSTVEGLLKAKEAGIDSSVMIVNGLAGREYSDRHALNSAKILDRIQPRFFSTLILMLPQGEADYRAHFGGTYIPMGPEELLRELEIMIAETHLERTIFRSNHASNFLPLKGVLSRDKDKLLGLIRSVSDRL